MDWCTCGNGQENSVLARPTALLLLGHEELAATLFQLRSGKGHRVADRSELGAQEGWASRRLRWAACRVRYGAAAWASFAASAEASHEPRR